MPDSTTTRTGPAALRAVAETLGQAVKLHQSGRTGEAETLYRDVLAAKPKDFDALHMLGVLMGQTDRFAEGEKLIAEALRVQPNSAEAWCNYGRVLRGLDRPADALAAFDKALGVNRDLIMALSNRGALLRELGRPEEALVSFDRALTFAPDHLDLLFNRGNALASLHRPQEALAAFDAVLARNAKYIDARIARTNMLAELGQRAAALAELDRLLSEVPSHVLALKNRGNLLMAEPEQPRKAAADFAAALQRVAHADSMLGSFIFSRLRSCDWLGLDEARGALSEEIVAGRVGSNPFVLVASAFSPAEQLTGARLYMAQRHPALASPALAPRRHDRLRIAYVSADFREHPVSHLAAGLFERHDRQRFEVTGISLAPDRPSPMTERLKRAFDDFVCVHDRSDRDVVTLMREREIDIAIDLNGHTNGARTSIFAARAAPIQVNYLGFAGTMGADYYDYILADRYVVPAEAESYYSEKVVCLPDSFMVTDSSRAIAPRQWSRAEAGLPEQGFVFCAFNPPHKISPAVFFVWMRLLREVEGSVLWLTTVNDDAIDSLRREAAALKVDPARLVFAPWVDGSGEHLARLQLADLFLDTPGYNAHATAVDALWAGVPVVTSSGNAFAARVAGSLLNTIGLPELITTKPEDYEGLALALARDPARLAALRAALAHNRTTRPLFDTPRFVRHIESAYTQMWDRQQRGEAPAAFAVEPIA